MGIEVTTHHTEGDYVHLLTDGTEAADDVREALADLGMNFTESSERDWPDEWPHPMLDVRLKEHNYDTSFRGQGPILFFFVGAMRHLREDATTS
ncbi:MAG: hypothetical protein M3Q36_04305 [bacterium]|nr:hypothetical protein [bacterium]